MKKWSVRVCSDAPHWYFNQWSPSDQQAMRDGGGGQYLSFVTATREKGDGEGKGEGNLKVEEDR